MDQYVYPPLSKRERLILAIVWGTILIACGTVYFVLGYMLFAS